MLANITVRIERKSTRYLAFFLLLFIANICMRCENPGRDYKSIKISWTLKSFQQSQKAFRTLQMVGKSFGLSVEIVLEYVKVLNSTTPLSSYGKNLKRILVLYHQVKTSVNLKFQLSIINKDPSQLVPQSTEGDFRDL